MSGYHKIQTIYLRGPDNKHKTLLEGEFARPEFKYLAGNEWTFTEKVDGTNISVVFDGHQVEFRGKTDRAETPKPLLNALAELFTPLPVNVPCLTLYGEGYGAGIQRGGVYRDTPGFVLFDALQDGKWMGREYLESLALILHLDIVPVIGVGTLRDAVEMARGGITSRWGDFPAEGIVARPSTELLRRDGKRVIAKIKSRDFAS